MGNVVREGDKVIVPDTGRDFEVPTIKGINEADTWQNRDNAHVAMVQVPKHMESPSAMLVTLLGCHNIMAISM